MPTPLRLEQVFSNLLINAAKYTPDGGDIALTMERIGKRMLASATPASASSRRCCAVFDTVRPGGPVWPCAEGGRGIGLAVVRDLVEMHGGSVQRRQRGLGLGSEFTVLLPALWAK